MGEEDKKKRKVKVPRDEQCLGIVEQLHGYCKMTVRCFDGNERMCRVPGRLTRKLYVREGDLVLVEPWDIQSEDKGDVIYKYRKNEINWLKRKGYLKNVDEEL